MRKLVLGILLIILAFGFATKTAFADDGVEYKYSLLLGAHYDTYDDYGKKVGEYRKLYDGAYPEARFGLFAKGQDFYLDFKGHFYDNKSMSGDFTGKLSNRVSAKVKYLMFRRELQTDLLRNINAREMLATGGAGGKMLTHEDLNPGYDFYYDRNRIESEVEVLLSEKNDVKLMAAHRFWNDTGHEQKIATMHCFSCHLSSQAAKVDRNLNQFNVGIEGKQGPIGVSYNFMYSKFQSEANPPDVLFDPAKHPVNGGAGLEFSSREIYSGEDIVYGVYPETEKIGNRVKFTSRFGRHHLSGSAFYNRSKNILTNLESSYLGNNQDNLVASSLGGTLNFSAVLNKTMRLIARSSMTRIKADSVYVNLPLWRYDYQGDSALTGGGQDFSFWRYSSLSRIEGKGSLEFTMLANTNTTVSILAGYEGINREDYPYAEADDATNRLIGQAKIRYREGLKYSLGFKYRLEKTDNPFTEYRGLFEEPGRDILEPLPGNTFIFYFQREDLRYQNVTTLPTIEHQLQLTGNLQLNRKVGLNANIKLNLDKNTELDSLDVEHTFFQPSLGFNISPDMRWIFAGGMRYQYYKSRGPIAVAMFDG
jgi:hypothetical protein